MKQMHITETVLRDAQQSLIATRMPFADFQGILDDMDQAGYHSIECWGGATFDSPACAICTRIRGSGCATSNHT